MEPPWKPQESDCCNSGCSPCILDVYEVQLMKYREETAVKNASDKINCLNPTKYTSFILTEQINVARDTFLFKFAYNEFNSGDKAICYNPGQYFMLKIDETTRAYTPIEVIDATTFVVLIKLYDGGKMSNYLGRIEIGAQTLWRGPYGDFTLNYSRKHLLFVAQGTGIAPIFSVLKTILDSEECESFIKLFFCCRSPHDILLRDHLYKFGEFWNFSCEIFVSSCQNFELKYNETVHENTRLGTNQVRDYLCNKLREVQVIICGSESFSESLKNIVNTCGVEDGDIFVF